MAGRRYVLEELDLRGCEKVTSALVAGFCAKARDAFDAREYVPTVKIHIDAHCLALSKSDLLSVLSAANITCLEGGVSTSSSSSSSSSSANPFQRGFQVHLFDDEATPSDVDGDALDSIHDGGDVDGMEHLDSAALDGAQLNSGDNSLSASI